MSGQAARTEFHRRAFLCAAAGLVAGIAGSRLGAAAPAAARLAVDNERPLAFLSSDTIRQADAASLHVDAAYADSGTATFNSVRYPLYRDGEYLIAILGAGQLATDQIEIAPGQYMVHLETQSSRAGALKVDLGIAVRPTDFPVDQVQLDPSLTPLLDPTLAQRELQQLKTSYTVQTPQRMWQGLFQWPVVGPITTNFGQARSYNGGPVSGHHSGVDIGVDMGTPIGAAAAGRVAFTGQLAERGNMIIIDHGIGVFTGYAHLSLIAVSVGQMVQQGDYIGRVGSTGLSTGPHLHWECAVNGVNVDASRWTTTLFP